MRGINQIRKANPDLANKIEKNQYGYILADDVESLIAIDRLMLVLVRCGNGRFLTPIQDLRHFMGIINDHAKRVEAEKGPFNDNTDYIRDVSLPA